MTAKHPQAASMSAEEGLDVIAEGRRFNARVEAMGAAESEAYERRQALARERCVGELVWVGFCIHLTCECDLAGKFVQRTAFAAMFKAIPLCPDCLQLVAEDEEHMYRRGVRQRARVTYGLVYRTYRNLVVFQDGDVVHLFPDHCKGGEAMTGNEMRKRMDRHLRRRHRKRLSSKKRRALFQRAMRVAAAPVCAECYERAWTKYQLREWDMFEVVFPLLDGRSLID